MATQKGRNWSSGDIVTAANLSSIERGVSAVAEEYTPTTWANGNTVTAVALNNIEQGIVNAGGGGGSSDFSTAEVTVTNNGASRVTFGIPHTVIDEQYNETYSRGYDALNSSAVGTYTVILYKGVADFSIITAGFQPSLSGTGDVQTIPNVPVAIITGDCTITISDESSGGSSQ